MAIYGKSVLQTSEEGGHAQQGKEEKKVIGRKGGPGSYEWIDWGERERGELFPLAKLLFNKAAAPPSQHAGKEQGGKSTI